MADGEEEEEPAAAARSRSGSPLSARGIRTLVQELQKGHKKEMAEAREAMQRLFLEQLEKTQQDFDERTRRMQELHAKELYQLRAETTSAEQKRLAQQQQQAQATAATAAASAAAAAGEKLVQFAAEWKGEREQLEAGTKSYVDEAVRKAQLKRAATGASPKPRVIPGKGGGVFGGGEVPLLPGGQEATKQQG